MTAPVKYGPYDAFCVLMRRGHKVSLRWNGQRRWWVVDGQRVTLSELEDIADQYRERYLRYTDRAPRALRSPALAGDLHHLGVR